MVPSAGVLSFKILLGLGEPGVCVLEKDQPQNRKRVLRRLKIRVRPQFVGSVPQPLLDIVVVPHCFATNL